MTPSRLGIGLRRCGISLLCLAAAAGLRYLGLPAGLRPDAEWKALHAERSRLAEYSAERLATLRAEAAAAASPPESAPPSGWNVESVPGRDDRRRLVRNGGLRWAELVAAVGDLDAHGALESLDVRSDGSRLRREIRRIEIVTPGPAPPGVSASAEQANLNP